MTPNVYLVLALFLSLNPHPAILQLQVCYFCSPLVKEWCCKWSAPSCCGDKIGKCADMVPNVPETGMTAFQCSLDADCPFQMKCCPIFQQSTQRLYHICQNPVFANGTGIAGVPAAGGAPAAEGAPAPPAEAAPPPA